MHHGGDRQAGVAVQQLKAGSHKLGLVSCGMVELLVNAGRGEKPAASDQTRSVVITWQRPSWPVLYCRALARGSRVNMTSLSRCGGGSGPVASGASTLEQLTSQRHRGQRTHSMWGC